MSLLLRVFWAICWFRGRPQDIPASPALLGVTLATYALAGALISLVTLPLPQAVGATLLDTSLLAGFVYAALQLRGYPGRFTQTLTALAGSLALIAWLSIPLTWWLYALQVSGSDARFPLLLLLLVQLWSIGVIGNVLRHSLEVSLPFALAVSLAYFILAVQILNRLFAPVG
jgi:hypothetical protein